MGQILTPELIQERWKNLKERRHMARTNLRYLCCELLGYKDVTKETHGEMIRMLQKFPGGTDTLRPDGLVDYEPLVKIEDLQGRENAPYRNTLICYPRSHLKTSIITIAHAIQWILNYPNVRIALSMAVGDQTEMVMRELKGHFQYNNTFRLTFPDYCPPPKKVAEWGNMQQFTVPKRTMNRKEPTVCLITVGKVIAGSHYDVLKHSDLVDENNVKTPGQIAEVISHFGHMDPLIERYPSDDPAKVRQGWQDVEGTRYDFGDLYGLIIAKPKNWNILVRGAFRDDGTTLDMRRFPPAELKRIQEKPEMTPFIFSCQYLNKPVPPEGGLCDPKEIVFIPRQVLRDLEPMLRVHCTIDLHGLEQSKNDNDFTVLNVHGFDRDGRLYILDVRRGRFTPSEFVWHYFDIMDRWPRLIDFKVEKVILWAALKATLQYEMTKRQKFACLVEFPRDTRISKQQRIRGLQPWFKSGRIRFADDLTSKPDIILEIMQFPSQSSGVHDDFLDTCADALQNQDGETNVDVIPDANFNPRNIFGGEKPKDRFLGFNSDGTEQWLYGNSDQKVVDSPTGVL